MVVRLVHLALGHHRVILAAGGLGDERQGQDRGAGEVVADLLGVDVQHRPEPPDRGELSQGALDVDPDVTGMDREREGLGGRKTGVELVVDEQAPDVAKGHPPDEIVDIDAAVAQCAALAVRFGNLGLEGDDALKPWPELAVAHGWTLSRAGVDAGSQVIVYCAVARLGRPVMSCGELP